MDVMQVNRAWLLAHPEQQLTEEDFARFKKLLQRRLAGEPVAYLLGYREFYGLQFEVTPATLIPRPETELLVDTALQHVPNDAPSRILDLGTGSGAIALSIAHARPRGEVVATDRSEAALEVAHRNVRRLALTNISILHSDWYDGLPEERFDVIVSNPPYVADNDPHLVQRDLRFEPATALSSGVDGLHDIRIIVANAGPHLKRGGWLLLEHGYDQAGSVREMLHQAGFREVFSARDLAGIERVSGGHYSQ
jgi:release factor glutamine methyltransferase